MIFDRPVDQDLVVGRRLFPARPRAVLRRRSIPSSRALAASSAELSSATTSSPMCGEHRGRIAGARTDHERALAGARASSGSAAGRAPRGAGGSGRRPSRPRGRHKRAAACASGRNFSRAIAPIASSTAGSVTPCGRSWLSTIAARAAAKSGIGACTVIDCYMPLIHLKFKLCSYRQLAAAPTVIDRKTDAGRRSRRRAGLDRAAELAPKALPLPGPDGGVVTQRTANPCTPVRFRLGPPPTIKSLSFHGQATQEWRVSAGL